MGDEENMSKDEPTHENEAKTSVQGSVQGSEHGSVHDSLHNEPPAPEIGDGDGHGSKEIAPEKSHSGLTVESTKEQHPLIEEVDDGEEEEEIHEETGFIGEDVGVGEAISHHHAMEGEEDEGELEGEGEEDEDQESVKSESETSSALSQVDPNDKLDKTRLLNAFEESYKYKKRAQRRRTLLNRKVSEYYRRQQNYGVFNQESITVQKDYTQRYRALLLEMDARMATKKQNAIDRKNLIQPLKKAIEQTKQEYTYYCETFAKLFYDTAITLQTGGKEMKETTVLNIIKRMQNVRNIINVERLEFIKTENLVAEIEVKAKSLEDLGNGLRMVDFEQLRSETQSLSDKIEERNNELEKLRLRCNADTQILAHVREKDFMLHKIITHQREVLKDTNYEVDDERERCNKLKVERDMYRKKHTELSIECGLLDKPPLLRDYDITVNAIEEKLKEIERLEMENEKIEKAIREIAIILSEGELIKTDSQKFEEKLLYEITIMDAPIFPRINKP